MIQKLTAFNLQQLASYLKPGMTVIDATLGNGHDAVFIKNHIGDTGILFGFDVQATALEKTSERLKSAGFKNFTFYCEDHAHLGQRFADETIDAIVYNLGYLPKGDHSITTSVDSTLKSIADALNVLKSKGILVIAAYPGHPAGKIECAAVESFLKTLDSKAFHAMTCVYLNQDASAPRTFIIERH